MADVRMRGIDVSYWQGRPAGSRYKRFKEAGWDFIIARIGYASEGINYSDSTFSYNYDMCERYDLKRGAYFYSNARNASEGRAEAEYVLRLLNRRELELPIWLDMEDPSTSGRASKSELAAACKAFCGTIEAAGYMAGVYASTSWFTEKIGDVGNVWKWVAQYNDQVTYRGKYAMWQYTSTAEVPGFTGSRDADLAYTLFDEKKPSGESYTGKWPKLPRRGYFHKGDSGKQVNYLQELLNWLLDGNLMLDGKLGQKTTNAVIRFQEEQGLTEDGLFGKKTLRAARLTRK